MRASAAISAIFSGFAAKNIFQNTVNGTLVLFRKSVAA
jgi:hypothetical protein